MAHLLDTNELQKNDCGSELQLAHQISISIDLISAAKQFLGFLKIVSGLSHLHGGSSAIQAIRRYYNYWIPLVAKSNTLFEEDLVPPLDVQWVWLCHCLKPKAYQHFCKTHLSKSIDTPLFVDPSTQSAAWERSKQLWDENYPNEPFEMEISQKTGQSSCKSQTLKSPKPSQSEEKELMESISEQMAFYNQASQQYMLQDGFLTVAKVRYLFFLYIVDKTKGRAACVPTCDIQLMLKCHQASPAAYAHDMETFNGSLEDNDSAIKHQRRNGMFQGFEQTSRTWEMLCGHPYERAGAVWPEIDMADKVTPLELLPESFPVTINWHDQSFDTNSKHEFLQPRYVLEVCVHIKSTGSSGNLQGTADDLFLGMKMMESCRNFKHQVSIKSYRYDTAWHKLLRMQCEVSTKGMIIELKSPTIKCLGAPSFCTVLGQVTLIWKELEQEKLLASEKPLIMKNASHQSPWMILASITPPVQAPYLFQTFLDRVTDDAGAMISNKMLRLKMSKPQEGRWMSQIVLNHAGRECFVIRIRVAAGVWRSKTERLVGVDWNERIICIHGGGWNYISRSTGIAPEEILATATPLSDELEQYKMKWSFSTGETLTIQMPIEDFEWEQHLHFSVKGNRLGVVRLLNGRHMQYEIPSAVPEEEEGFVTLVRYTTEARQGKATALFNWKMSAMEVLPEEDAVLVILICTATQRAVADLGGKTLRNFYQRSHLRKREKQRNWGSVVMGGGQDIPSELMFWYVNPEEVLGVNLTKMDNEEVLPKGASKHMYRGTSWLYAGSTKGLYKMSSKGSVESFGYDDHIKSSSLR